MAIKTRTGPYSKFDPRKMIAGEWGTVTEGDPNAADGTAVYMCFTPGNVKRMATYEDAVEIVDQAVGEVVDEHIDNQVAPTMEKCQKALANMNSAIQKADAATVTAKEATKNAGAATTAANDAAESASKSAQECKELLDETHIQVIDAAVKHALVVEDAEDEITGKTVSDLPEAATPADDNNMLIAAGNAIKKITWGNLLTAIKNKILTWTYDKLSTKDKTLPGAIEELNTNVNTIGKTTKFYAGGNFYVPGNDYSGLAIGTPARNDIEGMKFVSASDYKHYYTFPEGTYLVTINLFSSTTLSSTLGAALKIDVDDVQISNPWFRLIDAWQSLAYTFVVRGSKLKITMYTSQLIEIKGDASFSFIEFVRIA